MLLRPGVRLKQVEAYGALAVYVGVKNFVQKAHLWRLGRVCRRKNDFQFELSLGVRRLCRSSDLRFPLKQISLVTCVDWTYCLTKGKLCSRQKL